MSVEARDCFMNYEALPRGVCCNREVLKVEALLNGREHDPR